MCTIHDPWLAEIWGDEDAAYRESPCEEALAWIRSMQGPLSTLVEDEQGATLSDAMYGAGPAITVSRKEE